jgi:hypothetical protein
MRTADNSTFAYRRPQVGDFREPQPGRIVSHQEGAKLELLDRIEKTYQLGWLKTTGSFLAAGERNVRRSCRTDLLIRVGCMRLLRRAVYFQTRDYLPAAFVGPVREYSSFRPIRSRRSPREPDLSQAIFFRLRRSSLGFS